MTLGALLDGAARTLGEAGIAEPRREARLLIAHALALSPAALLLDREREVPEARVLSLVARRAGREPLALITGRRGFWTLDLGVSAATLIPRPDSEAVVEAALAACPGRETPLRVLDLGTGTGALLLAVLAERPRAWGLGIDRVPAAAALAAANARACGLAERSAFLAADWAAALDATFDLVLANPPYVRSGDIARLAPEVARHEPASALDGGPDGLDAYRALAPLLPRLLAPGGVAALELGQGQAESVGRVMASAGLDVDGLHADLGGVERVMVLLNA